MKRIFLILLSVVLFASCAENKPKSYTVILEGKDGFEDKKDVIQAVNDSVAYEQALLSYYAAKSTVKKYGFEDKYAYVSVYDHEGESLYSKLGTATIQHIKKNLSALPDIKEIQEADSKLPQL